MAVADSIRLARAQHPEKLALIVEGREATGRGALDGGGFPPSSADPGRCWSYEQLDTLTDRIGASLLRRGIRLGDRVALHFANSAETVFSDYACFKNGAVPVPLDVSGGRRREE